MCIYIITNYGLCNRLSWLCGHYSYNISRPCKYGNKTCTIYMKWEPSVSCNGRFQDIFKNFEHLKIVNNDNEVPKKISRYNGQHSVPNVYKMYKVNINSYTECLIFGLLQFKDDIESIAKDFMSKNFAPKTIGLHVRRTDHILLAKYKGNYTSDGFFLNLINKELQNNPRTKFYLATDNAKTQEIFLQKFPKNIIIRKIIKKNNKSLRHTTLKDAGIDMCLLSHCHHIEGSFHSSYSRVALMLNLIRRKQLEKADYELNKYVFRKTGL